MKVLLTLMSGIVLAATTIGCSWTQDDSPKRYALTGTVQLNGLPIPEGSISIEPHPTTGNHGPAAVAMVRDGAFELTRKDGHIGGDMTVFLFPPTVTPEMKTRPGMNFNMQKLNITLPSADGDCELNFEDPPQR